MFIRDLYSNYDTIKAADGVYALHALVRMVAPLHPIVGLEVTNWYLLGGMDAQKELKQMASSHGELHVSVRLTLLTQYKRILEDVQVVLDEFSTITDYDRWQIILFTAYTSVLEVYGGEDIYLKPLKIPVGLPQRMPITDPFLKEFAKTCPDAFWARE